MYISSVLYCCVAAIHSISLQCYSVTATENYEHTCCSANGGRNPVMNSCIAFAVQPDLRECTCGASELRLQQNFRSPFSTSLDTLNW